MVFLSERKIRLFTCFVGAITMGFFIKTKDTLIYMFRKSYYHGFFYQNERYAYLHVS